VEALSGMRLFLKVVECGSLSAAGRASGQSPASVSRKIAQLEDQIGAKLLNRTSRRLSLSQIGEVYHSRAAEIVAQIDSLNTAISEQQSVPRGTLKVRTRPSIARTFLLDALPSFLALYPDIALKLTVGEDTSDLDRNQADVEIRIGMPENPDLMIRRLSPGVERVVYASPAYLESHPRISGPEDLLNHNCLSILSVSGGEATSWHYRVPGGSRELRVAGNLTVNDADILHQAVIAGLGIGLLPAWIIAADLASGRVVRILPNVELTQTGFDFGLYAVFRRPDLILPRVRVFIDTIIEVFRRKDAEISRIAMTARRQSAETEWRATDALRWIHPQGLAKP
jgi:DNA-binding transcriptional LysR family regulator